jgi:hypothetical protein
MNMRRAVLSSDRTDIIAMDYDDGHGRPIEDVASTFHYAEGALF